MRPPLPPFCSTSPSLSRLCVQLPLYPAVGHNDQHSDHLHRSLRRWGQSSSTVRCKPGSLNSSTSSFTAWEQGWSVHSSRLGVVLPDRLHPLQRWHSRVGCSTTCSTMCSSSLSCRRHPTELPHRTPLRIPAHIRHRLAVCALPIFFLAPGGAVRRFRQAMDIAIRSCLQTEWQRRSLRRCAAPPSTRSLLPHVLQCGFGCRPPRRVTTYLTPSLLSSPSTSLPSSPCSIEMAKNPFWCRRNGRRGHFAMGFSNDRQRSSQWSPQDGRTKTEKKTKTRSHVHVRAQVGPLIWRPRLVMADGPGPFFSK